MAITFLFVICCISIVGCAVLFTTQLYQLLLLDAKSRGLEKPKLWAVIGASGSRGEGLLFYLFKRKNVLGDMSELEKKRSHLLKKRMNILLVIQAVSALLFVIGLLYQN